MPEVKPKAFNVENQLEELLGKGPPKPAARDASPLGDLADVDLNQMDDAALLENFENLLVDNIKLEGGELQIDFNINIDVPDYLQNDDINNSIASIIQFSQPTQLGDKKKAGGSAQGQLEKLRSQAQSNMEVLLSDSALVLPSSPDTPQPRKRHLGQARGLQKSI